MRAAQLRLKMWLINGYRQQQSITNEVNRIEILDFRLIEVTWSVTSIQPKRPFLLRLANMSTLGVARVQLS